MESVQQDAILRCGHLVRPDMALKIFQQMQHEGVQPDSHTFVRLLNEYASIVSCEEGRCAHEQIIQNGWDSDVIVRNSSMVDMYRIMAGLEGILLFLGLGMRVVALFRKPKNNRISNVTCH